MTDPSSNEIHIKRSVFNQKQFDQSYLNQTQSSKRTWSSRVKPLIQQFSSANILGIFSILNVIAGYKFKDHLVADILSGITVGIMQIPQVDVFLIIFESNFKA